VKQIKVVLIIFWIVMILGLLLNVGAKQIELKSYDRKIEYSIKKVIPYARLYDEYYNNIMILRQTSDCKVLSDSIFNSSMILRKYESARQNIIRRQK
jgi:hypothetical protein